MCARSKCNRYKGISQTVGVYPLAILNFQFSPRANLLESIKLPNPTLFLRLQAENTTDLLQAV